MANALHEHNSTEGQPVPEEIAPDRYELKFACERGYLPDILHWLCLDPAAVRVHHPPRTIQSLYFDTYDCRCLRENLAGVSSREKIRIRWYGGACDRVTGMLERKSRRDRLGRKRRLLLHEPIQIEGVSRVTFMHRLIRSVDAQWREVLAHGLEPSQWICYDRRYLRTFDGRVRVTVDQNIRAYDQRDRTILSRRCRTPLPGLVVLEFKSDVAHLAQLQELIQRSPVVLDRCSKYVLACRPQSGPALSVGPLA